MASEFQRKLIPGYGSITNALIQLIRFGPGAFGQQKFLVLLYHTERADTWGSKSADAHSAGQAMTGVFDRTRGEWIRGPVGVSRTTYKSANKQLIREGLLSKAKVTSRRGDADPSVYQVNWGALHSRLAAYKGDLIGTFTPLLADPTPADEVPAVLDPDNLDTSGHDRVGRLATNGWSSVDLPVGRVATNGWSSGDLPVGRVATDIHSETLHSSDLQCSDPTESSSAGDPLKLHVQDIRTALNQTLAEPLPENDPLPGILANLAQRAKISSRILCFWIEDAEARKRKAGDPIVGAGYWIAAARGNDLDRWLRENRRSLARWTREDEQLARAARLAQIPRKPTAPRLQLPPMVACPQCHSVTAVPFGELLFCTSAYCDPRGLTWADILKHYTLKDERDDETQGARGRAQGATNSS